MEARTTTIKAMVGASLYKYPRDKSREYTSRGGGGYGDRKIGGRGTRIVG